MHFEKGWLKVLRVISARFLLVFDHMHNCKYYCIFYDVAVSIKITFFGGVSLYLIATMEEIEKKLKGLPLQFCRGKLLSICTFHGIVMSIWDIFWIHTILNPKLKQILDKSSATLKKFKILFRRSHFAAKLRILHPWNLLLFFFHTQTRT